MSFDLNPFTGKFDKISKIWKRDATNGYIYPKTLTDKVGIGTATPASFLTVGTTNGLASKLVTISDRDTPETIAGANGILVDIDGGGGIYMTGDLGVIQGKFEAYAGALGIGTMSNHSVGFFSNNAERMAVLNDGNIHIRNSLGIGTASPSDKLNIVVADTDNVQGLLIEQNDVTNNPRCFMVNQNTTGDAFIVDNNSTGKSMAIDHDVTNVTFNNDMVDARITSTVTDGGSYNKQGSMIDLSSNVVETSGTITDSMKILQARQLNSGATGSVVKIENAGTGHCLEVIPTGLTGGAWNTGAIRVFNTANDGHALNLYSDMGDGANASIARFRADNVLFDQPVLLISNDGTNSGIRIDQVGAGAGINVYGDATRQVTIYPYAINIIGQSASTPYIDIDGTSTADLLRLKNNTNEVFVVEDDGNLITNSGAIFNETGIDVDFRVEGVGQANALFVQGSDGNVGIGTATPATELDVNGTIQENNRPILRYNYLNS